MTEIPRVPRVTLVVTLEGTPTLTVDASSAADRESLAAWIRTCRPNLEQVLSSISREIAAKKAA